MAYHRNRFGWSEWGGGAVLAALAIAGCAHLAGNGDRRVIPPSPQTALSCNDSGVPLDLRCAALPDTGATGTWVDASGTPLSPPPNDPQKTPGAYLDYDLWAWNSFIALNWPAVMPSDQNGWRRGFPDPTASFATAAPDALAVWETFKEKREVFLFDYVTKTPSNETPLPWNAKPRYGPTTAPVPDCPNTSSANVRFERHLASASETRKIYYDTLDETAEVASEARETRDALCAGYVANPATQCDKIGAPTCCSLHGEPVGPRVWRGDPYRQPGAEPVLYEVKVNYDYFRYVVDDDNLYYLVAKARSAASQGNINLPARTSSATMPPRAGQQASGMKGTNPGPMNYSARACLTPGSPTPCLAGSVQLKAAWMDISDLSSAEQSSYHTAELLVYVTNHAVPGNICKQPKTFGLVGLHIIQRIHQDFTMGGNQTQPPKGGTYVFATWEHTGADDQGFTYANYSGAPPTGNPTSLQPYPNIKQASALPLNRVYPPLASTSRATTLVHKALGCPTSGSVWCNYRLIGVQYAATSTPTPEPTQLDSLVPQSANIEAPAGSGQPYYLANLVIESNVGLQQFQGLPLTIDPHVITVIDHYRGNNPGNVTSSFSTSKFQRDASNLAFRTHMGGRGGGGQQPSTPVYEYNMGGCMGCHGVAQLSGYSFSFVLLGNQYGAAPDTQTDFAIPPITKPPPN
jgi:hypothetical protein